MGSRRLGNLRERRSDLHVAEAGLVGSGPREALVEIDDPDHLGVLRPVQGAQPGPAHEAGPDEDDPDRRLRVDEGCASHFTAPPRAPAAMYF